MSDVVVRPVDLSEAATFDHLTFPSYRGWLRVAGHANAIILAVDGAFGEPAALCIARRYTNAPEESTLLSLAVAESYRRQGVGRAVLHATIAELARRGSRRCEVTYTVDPADPGPFDHLLARYGFAAPEVRMLLCRNQGRVIDPPWSGRSPLPSGWRVQPWSQVAADQREALRTWIAGHDAIAQALSPFRSPEPLHEDVTQALVDETGRVAGWLLAHCLDERTLRYSSIYLRDDLQGGGFAVALLSAAIACHVAQVARWPDCSFGVRQDNPMMLRFARRHLAPLLTHTRESRSRTCSW